MVEGLFKEGGENLWPEVDNVTKKKTLLNIFQLCLIFPNCKVFNLIKYKIFFLKLFLTNDTFSNARFKILASGLSGLMSH